MGEVVTQAVGPDEKASQLPDPVRHVVTITGWSFARDEESVAFEVQGDADLKTRVHFSLSPLDFVVAELDEFIETVLQREPFKCEHFTRKQNLSMNFNTMVGRRVAMYVVKTKRAMVVLDCESVPSGSSNDRPGAATTLSSP